jgi:hypothetical protein
MATTYVECEFCHDCAGSAPKCVNRKIACKECADELLKGEIPGPDSITAGKPGGRGSQGDYNPSQENAIRYMEDGRHE